MEHLPITSEVIRQAGGCETLNALLLLAVLLKLHVYLFRVDVVFALNLRMTSLVRNILIVLPK